MGGNSRDVLLFVGTLFQRRKRWLAMPFLALFLAACGDSQIAFLTEGDVDHSLTLERNQDYFSGPWKTTLIVAGMPQCQRRYPLDGLAKDKLRIDVYRPEPGIFILAAGQRWYVAALQSCGFQMYQQPPPEPGDLVGSFQTKNSGLRYSPKLPAKPVE